MPKTKRGDTKARKKNKKAQVQVNPEKYWC